MKYTFKSKHLVFTDATLSTDLYPSGELAVILTDFEGPEKVSVSLKGYDTGFTPGIGEFWVKNYSEHEGLPKALEDAGVAKAIAASAIGPFQSSVVLMKLSKDIVT